MSGCCCDILVAAKFYSYFVLMLLPRAPTRGGNNFFEIGAARTMRMLSAPRSSGSCIPTPLATFSHLHKNLTPNDKKLKLQILLKATEGYLKHMATTKMPAENLHKKLTQNDKKLQL